MNWVDLIIIAILGLYAFKGMWKGLIAMLIELLGYIISFILALKFGYLGETLIRKYTSISLPQNFEGVIGIIVIWIVFIIVYYFLAPIIIKAIPSMITNSIINKLGGGILSMVKGVIIVSLILFVFHFIPLNDSIKTDINNSYIANAEINATTTIANKLTNNLYSNLENAIKNVNLQSNNTTDIINLGYKINDISNDLDGEKDIFNYINEQRKNNNIPLLTLNDGLSTISRDYAKYMFVNGFFGHTTPSGQTEAQRLSDAKISYVTIGENIYKDLSNESMKTNLLANTDNKSNILNPKFAQIGVGIADGKIFGKIYVLEFIGN